LQGKSGALAHLKVRRFLVVCGFIGTTPGGSIGKNKLSFAILGGKSRPLIITLLPFVASSLEQSHERINNFRHF
jgi:hypothetical protein